MHSFNEFFREIAVAYEFMNTYHGNFTEKLNIQYTRILNTWAFFGNRTTVDLKSDKLCWIFCRLDNVMKVQGMSFTSFSVQMTISRHTFELQRIKKEFHKSLNSAAFYENM